MAQNRAILGRRRCESTLPVGNLLGRTRRPLGAVIPTHPCPACGHTTEQECSAVSERLKTETGVQCLDCLHLCLERAMSRPSPPGSMPQPVSVPNTLPSTPVPPSPSPDLAPPPGF
jgi:hypothetical protein